MRKRMWKLFYRNASMAFAIRRRFSHAGLFVLMIWFLAALFGLDTRNSLGSMIFSVLSVLLLLGLGYGLFFRPHWRVSRQMPRYATVGEPLVYSVSVENLGNKPLNGLMLREQEPDPRPDYESFRRAREPIDEAANAVDRYFGYPRWSWLLRRNKKVQSMDSYVSQLLPGGMVRVKMRLTPQKRGSVQLPAVLLKQPDPFGLCFAYARKDIAGHFICLPKRYALPAIPLPGQKHHQPGGVGFAGSAGESQEFVGLREYRPQDNLRHICWKSWARLQQPVVKEYQQEYHARHALVLDTSRLQPISNQADQAFEEAVSIAASLVSAVDTREQLLDLIFVCDHAYQFTAGSGCLSQQGLLEVLACVQNADNDPFERLRRTVSGFSGGLNSVICILLQWDPVRAELVRYIRSMGVFVKIIVVHHPQHALQLEPDERDITVIDCTDVEQGLARL